MLVVLGRTRHVNGEHKCRSKSESQPHGDPHVTSIDTTGCISRYGEVSFADTHRYGDATANRRHSPGTPLSP
jgi:hypothetical protein